ncbi:hypothetical protein GPECTOR_12g476 [Gonium pectorale]|uniref:Uncharacterized protein n=1 Tax=Gonium pectorale TaxID=33097 RepID=A0A150GNU6_GONPE|nr:hypothetical protein GPECTOR_12g476 [Gonium pectorale]|eukprot:KXZ51513.1 hypothetical protein GPECTOR_12g476 [Gonium pectorale]
MASTSGNETRHSMRASGGQMNAVRHDFTRPDTLIVGPDGKTLVLGRPTKQEGQATGFHKYNPARRGRAAAVSKKNPKFAKLPSARLDGDALPPQGPLAFLSRIPLMNLVLTAVLVHRVASFVGRRLFGGPNAAAAGGRGAGAGAAQRQRQLVRPHGEYGEDDEEDWDELDERAEELLEQMQHASMLPTMLRSSLPKPQRTNLAKRAAAAHRNRPRGHRTSHAMLHGGPTANVATAAAAAASAAGGDAAGRRPAARRPLGKLEKMDLIVRQQVRAAMLAQQRQQILQLQQQGGGEALPALPAGASHAGPLALPAGGGQQMALVPAGGSAAAPYASQLPLPPPPFRPLPPHLLARLAGAPQVRAAAAAPSARPMPPVPPASVASAASSSAAAPEVGAAVVGPVAGKGAQAEGGCVAGSSGQAAPGSSSPSAAPASASPRTASPEYHVAYRDVTQPPRWTAKGWVGIDDYIKPRRGTAPSVYGSSSLMPPSAPPRHSAGLAPLAAPCPNEVRLQELLALQRRKVATEPGPGAYQPRDVGHHRRFRRPADPSVDGPFMLDQMPDGTSTRVKEIAALIRTQGDSGLGPGDYEGMAVKDLLMRSAPQYKVPVTDRDGRAAHAKTLSISRSIQHGIDWHVPIIVEPPPGQRDAASSSGGCGGSSAPTTARSDGGSAP